MAIQPAIQLEHINKSFGDKHILHDLCISVQPGTIFGFLGPNGSGKSTTIKILCGLLNFEGAGFILGMNIRSQMADIRHKIGYMSQQFGLYGDMTVLQNLQFYGSLYGVEGAAFKRRVEEIGKLTQIKPYLTQKARFLSGGWKQRLALACAIIHKPPIVFLDEPTAGIDPVARRDLWDLLFDLSSQGMTLFVTTHYMDEAERCNRLAYIFQGRLIANGTSQELRQLQAVTPAGARRLEITCEPIMRAYRLLGTYDGVLDVTIFGSQIHAMILESITNETIVSFLEANSIDVDSVKQIQPSLEDVFVSLTQSAIAEAK